MSEFSEEVEAGLGLTKLSYAEAQRLHGRAPEPRGKTIHDGWKCSICGTISDDDGNVSLRTPASVFDVCGLVCLIKLIGRIGSW